MKKTFLKSFARKLGYVLAGFIIFIAVIVCVVRLLAPVLDNHRGDFEKIATQFLQTPVTIKNVRVSWYRYTPVINLNRVTIIDQASQQPVFKIKKVSILVSIFQSLWQRKVVTSGIMASGAELNIHEAASGELKVKEFSSLPFNQQSQGETRFTDVMAWLSQEPYLILSDIDLYYTGVGKKNRFVTLYNLNFENSATEHKIFGKAILHQEIPTEVSLVASWRGKLNDIPAIKANAYLYISGLSLAEWAKDLSLKGWQVKQGMMSAKIWGSWEQGAVQKIQTTFQSYDLELYSDVNKATHRINRLSGNIGWKREGAKQILAGDEILIDLPHHLWPVTSFSVAVTPDATGVLLPNTINVGYLDLADVQPFLDSMPAILPDAMKDVSKRHITGALQNVAITFAHPWNNWQQLSFSSSFSQLHIPAWEKYPGVNNLSGNIKWNGSQGEISFNSLLASFQYDSIFKNNIHLDQLTGGVKVQREANKWLFTLNGLHLLNTDMTTNVNGTISLAENASPVADISANMTMREAKNVTRYLPSGIFDKTLNTWLANAFLAGEISSGHAVLRGSLADFPFDNGKGEFSITSKVNNIDFRFAPNWPVLRHVTGVLTFTGRKMTVDVDHADTLGISLKKVQAVIPYLGDAKPQVVNVTTDVIQADFSQAMQYVHASPLEKNIGKMFAGVELQGVIGLKLGLSVPLANPDLTHVQADLSFTDSVMDLVPWNLKLEHLNGQVTFTENSAQGKNIRAELFNKPLQFDLTTRQKAKNVSVIEASFHNDFELMDFENWLKLPFSNVAKGWAKISGLIDFSFSQPMEIKLRSRLQGTSISLPEQYGKKINEARDFSADIWVQHDQPMKIKLGYGQLFSTALMLERQQDKYNLLAANLHFGKGEADWPAGKGIYITGEFDTLDWNKIKSLGNQASTDKTLSAYKLKGIDVRVNQIKLGNQLLNKVNLQVIPDEKDWDIHVDSEEVTGQLTVPIGLPRQSLISAQFQKIDIHATTESAQTGVMLDAKTLPGMRMIANDVRYNDIPLGKIIFNATPSAAGLNIQGLRIVSPHIDLRASGEWRQSGKNVMTHLQGGATSSHVSRLLSSFGLDVKNFVSSTGSLNFNLVWPAAPFAPSLATLNGRASLVMGAGRIVDIGAENGAKMDIGRMLSIFSLQTIPRRLSLDFSDVFQKGYSFDSLRGDFVIKNGELYTNNMLFDGPVAKVGINGKIGLSDKTYNFILSVTAHVTSSIPVAATLLTGNPLIGLGALAVNTVLGSKVSSVITNYYAVTGTWDNPVWKSVRSGNLTR